MKTPKVLLNLCKDGMFVEALTFDHTKRGWAIVDADMNELAVFEPCYYSNGDRWLVRNYSDKNWTGKYFKRLNDPAIKSMPLVTGHTGYKLRATTKGRNGVIAGNIEVAA